MNVRASRRICFAMVGRVVLIAAVCAAGSPAVAGPLDWFRKAPSCSTNPNHEANSYIDFTAGKSARQVFSDLRAAALADAAARNAPADMKSLLQQGASPNARGEQGITLLAWTLRRGSHEAFETLLDAGADATVAERNPTATPSMDDARTVLHEAAMIEDPSFLEMLLAHHVSPDLQVAGNHSALDEALLSDCDKQFHQLIGAHANVSIADTIGDTPLHYAAQINAFERIMDLLQAGADPLARNHIGQTFQVYLRIGTDNTMTQQARSQLAQIDAWLSAHHVPLEGTEARVAQRS